MRILTLERVFDEDGTTNRATYDQTTSRDFQGDHLNHYTIEQIIVSSDRRRRSFQQQHSFSVRRLVPAPVPVCLACGAKNVQAALCSIT